MTTPKKGTGGVATSVTELVCSVSAEAGTEDHSIHQPPVADDYKMALVLPKDLNEN